MTTQWIDDFLDGSRITSSNNITVEFNTSVYCNYYPMNVLLGHKFDSTKKAKG